MHVRRAPHALASGVRATRVEAFRCAGLELGVAFQIADDWLDREDDEPCSWVAVGGADAARERAEALLARALERIDRFGDAAEPLRELMRFAVRRSF